MIWFSDGRRHLISIFTQADSMSREGNITEVLCIETFACGHRCRLGGKNLLLGVKVSVQSIHTGAVVNFNPWIACVARYRRNDYEHFYNPPLLPRKFLDIYHIPERYFLDICSMLCSKIINFNYKFIKNY